MQFVENILDYDTYISLRKSVNWKCFSEEQTRKALATTLYSVVVKEDGQAVGMARIVGDGLYVLVVDVIVMPAYQGKGIGRAIMEKLLSHVQEITPEGGRASIQLIAEKGKEEFYKKLGFKLIPHEFCGAGMRKVICK